jgi:alkylation response protein AidB-like acyl-CoA dehydrogenase
MGMAASATGHVDFTGLHVSSSEIVGAPGDYYRSPYFAGGAWRVLAVQLGGLERLVAEFRNAVKNSGKADDPVQRARFGETVARLGTARLWSGRAALMAEDDSRDPATVDAFVNLARHSFERAALDIIERVQRGIGLSAMLRPARVELVMRDLLTYLRQPFPDGALDAAARWSLDTDADMHSDIGEP